MLTIGDGRLATKERTKLVNSYVTDVDATQRPFCVEFPEEDWTRKTGSTIHCNTCVITLHSYIMISSASHHLSLPINNVMVCNPREKIQQLRLICRLQLKIKSLSFITGSKSSGHFPDRSMIVISPLLLVTPLFLELHAPASQCIILPALMSPRACVTTNKVGAVTKRS